VLHTPSGSEYVRNLSKFLVALVPVLFLLLLWPASALGQDEPSCRFHGTVTAGGEPVADGTEIKAIILDKTFFTTAVTVDGVSTYELVIVQPADRDFTDKYITFIVGTRPADQKLTQFVPGGDVEVNLTTAGEVAGPTLLPTVAVLLLLGAVTVALSPLNRRLSGLPAGRYGVAVLVAGFVAGAIWLLSQFEWTWREFPVDIFIPVVDWGEAVEDWAGRNLDPLFDFITVVIREPLLFFRKLLGQWLPWWVVLTIFTGVAGWLGGRRIAALAAIGMFFVGGMGLWPEAMDTLSIMMVAVIVAVAVGIPTGILAGRSDRFESAIRPVLDVMQTMPSFVYLVPVVLFLGLGMVPGVIATFIYAVPPCIRLTSLGIRQVSPEVVEAGRAFGSSPWQLLIKVQLPLSLPSIMAGVTQTIMLALAMVVIASMVGAQGLGMVVLEGIKDLEVGKAFTGGAGIVVLAIILDRISQGIGKGRRIQQSPG
jgi:glycine betaine/proline transport system permease protein